jgi:glutamate/tyrosine decarboxylase-like PLP-dependent enzyme
MTKPGKRLDPTDWAAFRHAFHDLVDHCLDRMEHARDLPWVPKDEHIRTNISLDCVDSGQDEATVFQEMVENIMPYATGNTHPRFFGWVHGTGQPVGAAADLVASVMNSNLGGRDHGAMEVERTVIDWTCGLAGLPESASGILTTGTSQATLLALCAARVKALGANVRKRGVAESAKVRVYAVQGAHSCVAKALEVMGHGHDALAHVPPGDDGAMDITALHHQVAMDRAAGIKPLAVVGTAGTVDTGLFDHLGLLADFCAREGIWLHIDAAFGFWTLMADDPWRSLAAGIERADSIATDFHKWIGVPYDCGICMVRDNALHRSTFAMRPSYLEGQAEGLAGGDMWFCDYGLDLSRGFRALKVWATIKSVGLSRLAASITDNCSQAALLGRLVDAAPWCDLIRPVQSNVCCFAVHGADASEVAARLQLSGDAVFSTTVIDNQTCLRAAIVNHRTTQADIEMAFAAVEKAVLG